MKKNISNFKSCKLLPILSFFRVLRGNGQTCFSFCLRERTGKALPVKARTIFFSEMSSTVVSKKKKF